MLRRSFGLGPAPVSADFAADFPARFAFFPLDVPRGKEIVVVVVLVLLSHELKSLERFGRLGGGGGLRRLGRGGGLVVLLRRRGIPLGGRGIRRHLRLEQLEGVLALPLLLASCASRSLTDASHCFCFSCLRSAPQLLAGPVLILGLLSPLGAGESPRVP